jgi:hypothetical protein
MSQFVIFIFISQLAVFLLMVTVSVTHLANIWLLPGVNSHVSDQLVLGVKWLRDPRASL